LFRALLRRDGLPGQDRLDVYTLVFPAEKNAIYSGWRADHDGHGDTDGHHRTTIIRSLFSRYSNSWSSSQRTSTTPARP
jgi:hypothetical protein